MAHTPGFNDSPFALFDHLSVGVVYQDGTGAIAYANVAAQKILGLSLEQLQGRTSVDPRWRATHEDGSPFPGDTHPAMAALATGKPVEDAIMGVYNPAEDATRWIRINAVPEFKDGAPSPPAGVYTVFEDITELKLKERALAEANEHLQQIVDATPLPMLISKGANIILVNRKFRGVIGYTIDDIPTLVQWWALAHPDPAYREEVRTNWDAALKAAHMTGAAIAPSGTHIRCKDGQDRIFTLSFSSHGEYGIAIMDDITNRKLAQDALVGAQQKLRAILENVGVGIAVISPEMKILDMNRTMRNWFPGIDLGQQPICYRSYNDPPNNEVCTYCPVIKTLKDGQRHESITATPAPDGLRHFRVISSAIKDAEGNIIAAIEMVDNITERMRAEEAERQTQRKLALYVDQSPLAVIQWDTAFNAVEWNPAAERIFGFTREEALGRHACDIIVDASQRASAQSIFDALLRQKGGHRLTYENITKDGGKITCEWANTPLVGADGAVMGVLSLAQDVTERRKMGRRQEESEELFRGIFEKAGVGMAIATFDGKFMRVNAALSRMMGYSEGELLHMNIADLSNPDDLKKNFELIQQLVAGGIPSFQMEKRYLRKDGHTVWGLLNVTTIRDADGSPVRMVAQVQDITEQKRSEEQLGTRAAELEKATHLLRNSEARLREAILNSPHPVMMRAEGGEVLLLSRAWTEITGYSLEDIPTTDAWIEKAYGENTDSLRAAMETSYNDTEVKRFGEARVRTATGDIRIWDFRSEPVPPLPDGRRVVISMAVDVTERRSADQRLKDAFDFNAKVLETSPIGIAVYDQAGECIMVNDTSCAITGKSREQLLSQNFRAMEAWQRTGIAHLPEEALRENTTKAADVRYENDLGKELWLHVIFTPFAQATGTHLMVMANDITERKSAEIEAHAAKEQAEEATKLKDRFVSLVAHDLKSPFASIVGFLKLMAQDEETPLNPVHRELVNRLLKTSTNIVTLVDELLDLSRLRTGTIKPAPEFVDASMVALSCVENNRYAAEAKGIKLVNEIPRTTRIYADQRLFSEVLHNLVSNGVKFTPKGGSVRLFAPRGRKSVIAVQDTGVGIPPAFLPNLFRAEIKTSTEGTAGEKGTGLGLPYSYDIMKAHGGNLKVESAGDTGTIVYAELPHIRPLVLVVDDERSMLQLMAEYLRPLDVECITALNGAKAMELMKEFTPHLVISDIRMPVLDGFAMLKRMRADLRLKPVPVIVITSDSDMKTRELAFQMGANDFVTKPVEIEDIIPRARRFLEKI